MLCRWTLALQTHPFKFAMLNWIFLVLMFSIGSLRLNNILIITREWVVSHVMKNFLQLIGVQISNTCCI